jgi:hypothetical protein
MCSYVVFYVLKKYKHTYTVLTTIRCIYTSRPRRRSTRGKDSPSLVAPMGDRRGTLAATRLGPLVLLPPSPNPPDSVARQSPSAGDDMDSSPPSCGGLDVGRCRRRGRHTWRGAWRRGCLGGGMVASRCEDMSMVGAVALLPGDHQVQLHAGDAGLALIVEAWHGWWQRR